MPRIRTTLANGSGTYLSQSAAAQTYLPKAANTLVLIGDSICAFNAGPLLGPSTAVTPYGYWQARGYWTWANTFLKQRFKVLSNAGVGGQRLDQIVARVASDVVAYSPAWCFLQGGTNSVSQGRTASQIETDFLTGFAALAAAGIRIITATITTQKAFSGATLQAGASIGGTSISVDATPGSMNGDTLTIDSGASAETVTVTGNPTGTGPYAVPVSALTKTHSSGALVVNNTKMAVLSAVNEWLRSYARDPVATAGSSYRNAPIILVPFNKVYADPSTGAPYTGMALDGTHPTIDGAAYLGKAAADVLDPLIPKLDSTGSGGETTNLIPNGGQNGTAGVFSGFSGTTSGQIADSWTLFGSTATVAASKVARTDGIPGFMQQFAVTAGYTGAAMTYQAQNTNAGTDWNIGDTVWLEVEFEGDGDVSAPTPTTALVDVALNCFGGSLTSHAMQASSGSDGSSTIWPGKAVYRTNAMVIPASTTRLQAQIYVNVGGGTFRIGRVMLHKGAI